MQSDRYSHRWQDDIKTDLRETGHVDANWCGLTAAGICSDCDKATNLLITYVAIYLS
jgi:hypothetical protein